MRWGVLLLSAAVLAGCSVGGSSGGDNALVGSTAPPAPSSPQSQAPANLGFPVVATRNTVRAAGSDPATDLAAAAWAARSGDSVLFTQRDRVPAATLQAIAAHDKPDIYILGPESVISKSVEARLRRLGPVRRVQGSTPVANAVALARYSHNGFG